MIFNHGLVLGKFYPPHLGHIHLIQEAKKKCNHLTVIISSISSELIPGSLREHWLRNIFSNKDIEIIWITDENPQYPNEHPDFWKIWRHSIQRVLKTPLDVIFTSESYGDPLSEILNTKHVCIDLERNNVPVSATKIRNEPLLYWDYIPDIVKPFFLKRIVITGPESVGKSTLTKDLAQHFETHFVPEYAREYLDKMGRYVIESDILNIGKGHLEREAESSKNAYKFLFLDTDHITTKIYSEFYFKNCPQWVTLRAQNLAYDHSLMLDIDVPWVADPQRDLGEYREQIKGIFLKEMNAARRKLSTISGTFEERFKNAVSLVEQIGKEPMNPIYFTEAQIHLRSTGLKL